MHGHYKFARPLNLHLHSKTRKKRIKRKHKTKKNVDKVKILYTNANGIRGKVESLYSALVSTEAHFATIVETKLEGDPPSLNGYTWVKKNRSHRCGGGVAIAIRNDIIPQVRMIDNIEPDDETEIMWVAVENKNKSKTQTKKSKNLAIGIFYGPQENECREKVEKIYSVVATQINTIKQTHKIVLTGDFNAKLPIKTNQIEQKLSPNGKCLQQMLEITNTTPCSITMTEPQWTRINRKNPCEKAILDYVVTDRETNNQICSVEIDSEGTYRLENNNEIETDMNL